MCPWGQVDEAPPVGYRGATKMVPPAKKKLLGGIDTRHSYPNDLGRWTVPVVDDVQGDFRVFVHCLGHSYFYRPQVMWWGTSKFGDHDAALRGCPRPIMTESSNYPK